MEKICSDRPSFVSWWLCGESLLWELRFGVLSIPIHFDHRSRGFHGYRNAELGITPHYPAAGRPLNARQVRDRETPSKSFSLRSR